MSGRLGANYFVTCSTCGSPGHKADSCPAKTLYHQQAVKQLAKGSQDPNIVKEVYGSTRSIAIMRLSILIGFLLLASFALGQAGGVFQGSTAIAGNGNVLRTVPHAQIVVCGYPSTGPAPCTNTVTTYTTPGIVTACPTNAPVLIPGTTTCSGTSDAAGNFSFIVAAGQNIAYYFKYLTTWYGPYVTSIGVGGSSSNFASPPPLGNVTPNTVGATTVTVNGDGLFFQPQSNCIFEGTDPTLHEVEDVAGKLMWLPQGLGGPCTQILTYTPLPDGVNPSDKQVIAYDAASGAFTVQSQAGGGGSPGGSSGQSQYNNAGAFAGYTMGGDCTLVASTGVITCTKTNGSAFAASATTDATNATNIGSGTLNAARLPATAVQNNQANTYSGGGLQGFSAVDLLQPVHAADPGTCTAGQIEFNSTGAAMKLCASTNAWTALSTGTTTNALTANNSNSGAASGTTFNGSAAITISSNTIGAPNLATANTFTTGLQDMSAADYLQPKHASDPGTCTEGQIEENTTSHLMKFCSATNTWTSLSTGTTTNALTVNNGNSGAASGSTFNGSSAVTISTNSIGAPNLGTANTFGAFLQDLSASTIKLPVAAGFTTTANGNMGYDSTNLNWKIWQNGADRIVGVINGSTTNGDCSKFVVSGSTVSLQDSGAGCGPVSVSQLWLPSGTPNELPISPTTQTGQGTNTLGCIQFVPTSGITATKMSVSVNTVSAAQTFNVGIYDNSLNLVRDSGAFACGSGGGIALTNTVSSFTLTPGSTYYACVAFTDATCAIQGLGPTAGYANIANKNATRNFTCANALSAGALPGSCGVQTPVTGKQYIILLEQ